MADPVDPETEVVRTADPTNLPDAVRSEDPTTGGPFIVFAGGGTGGHLFPALAVAEAIREVAPAARFLFLATTRPIDARVLGRSGHPMLAQDVRPLGGHPAAWAVSSVRLIRATRRLIERFRADRPTWVVGSGGFASVPGVVAAIRLGIATALLNPDARPGRANRLLARMVNRVFVQWAGTAGRFSRGVAVEVTGCPVRRAFASATRERGQDRFESDPSLRTLLVTGASQGARSLNNAVFGNLAWMEERGGWQVLHLTGSADFDEAVATYRRRNRLPAKVLAFTDHMPEAIAAADLVVSRAGASTLAEITAAGKPSILMPYPHDRGRHQTANADALVQAGAARVVPDTVDPVTTAPALRRVLAELMDDEDAREQMGVAAARLGSGQAAARVAARLLEPCASAACENRVLVVEPVK
jgi:UDP-N-acetylglucosamine--N-acetylmuramyl-(pentapeptide) pyrophosphoryl-undecaprenol N-acetylglucosamine transferase